MNYENTFVTLSNLILDKPILLLFLFGGLSLLIGTLFYAFKLRKQKEPNQKNFTSERPLTDIEEIQKLDQASWLLKLREGLGKTRQALLINLQNLFQGNTLSEELLNSLHETLYRSDISAKAVDRLIHHLKDTLKATQEKNPSWDFVKTHLSEEIERILDIPNVSINASPKIILIVGVNGVGKTTTIGKLAAHYLAENKSVLICAADTYRAAAIDQLQIWGQRLGVKVIAHQEGSDPAAVAFDSVKAAVSRKSDILLIDTAGRLHNKKHLMDELAKITRVIKKEIPDAPHETLLVIDATTGQNAFMQVRAFQELTKLTGICLTKLDGTAKGGVVIGLAEEFRIPIKYIGVGEKSSDLRSFQAKDFVKSLFS